MIVKNEKTMDWFRAAGPCEYCRQWQQRRDPHHCLARGHGGGSRLDLRANLVGLCRMCHTKHGDDPDMRSFFLDLIAVREGFSSGEAVLDYLQLVLRTPKGSPMPPAPTCPW